MPIGERELPSLDRLSPRERQVLELIEAGFTQIQIATQLGIARGTVKMHRRHVQEKLHPLDLQQAQRRVWPQT